jgi:hypothetical protein
MGPSAGVVDPGSRKSGGVPKIEMGLFEGRDYTKMILNNNGLRGLEFDRAASAMCAILQHTPEKPLRRSAASQLSIAL